MMAQIILDVATIMLLWSAFGALFAILLARVYTEEEVDMWPDWLFYIVFLAVGPVCWLIGAISLEDDEYE